MGTCLLIKKYRSHDIRNISQVIINYSGIITCNFNNFRARFRPQFSERDAAKAIIEVVESSCLNIRYQCDNCIIIVMHDCKR